MQNNPLLTKSNLKYGAVPFQQILPEHFLPALEEAIRQAKLNIAGIKSQPPSFTATIEALESSNEMVDWIATNFFNLLGAESNDALQELAQKVGPLVAAHSSDILLDAELFTAIDQVFKQRQSLNLNTEQLRLLENTHSDFVRNGARLKEEQKQRLREIDQRLSQLSPKFSENVLKSSNAFELYLSSPEELKGLPESALEAAKAAATTKGKADQWLFTLQAPSITPFLKYADHRPSREKLWRAFNTRSQSGEFDNRAIIQEMITLRFERAQLLGYQDHAHFTLEKRMAESADEVNRFLERLYSVCKPAAQKQVSEVEEYARAHGGPTPLMPWDFSYWSEKLKNERYAFNEEDLRPYFQLEKVTEGVFTIAQKLFDLEFRPTNELPTYHSDVKVFEVFQNRQGRADFIGLFYADFFPRPGKRDGAWMTNFLEQGRFQGEVRRPHVSIVCNFTKPTATKPSLLTYTEVETLFHEFGHALHSLLSRCHYRSLSGTNVYWDFVELPSQVMENWTQEKEALDIFARHYQTGAAMPIDLIEKLKKSQTYLSGYFALRQLSFAMLDMSWHTTQPQKITDVLEFEKSVIARTSVLPLVPEANVSCAFGHIFGGGYAAGYYSYKWAEVLDADAFAEFAEKGIFNREVAERFENHILSRGGSEHPAELYRRFRGRDPDPNALLKRDGLI